MDPRKLHRRILIVLGAITGLLAGGLVLDLAVNDPGGITGIVDFLGCLVLVGGYMLHAALSSIFVGRATTRKGVVLAHVASILALAAWCVLPRH